MKKIWLTGSLGLLLSIQALAADKIIACPALSIKQYGKTVYHDPHSGRVWDLTWFNRQQPVWDKVVIPQTTLCGAGKSIRGLSVTYQCAVFQCKSSAVIASLGQHQPLRCFSAYVSTQNSFYCDSFSLK